MTAHQVTARVESIAVCFIAAVVLISLVAHSQYKDECDDDAVRTQAEQQERAAAQPDTWPKLDQQSRQMVSFDRFPKK